MLENEFYCNHGLFFGDTNASPVYFTEGFQSPLLGAKKLPTLIVLQKAIFRMDTLVNVNPLFTPLDFHKIENRKKWSLRVLYRGHLLYDSYPLVWGEIGTLLCAIIPNVLVKNKGSRNCASIQPVSRAQDWPLKETCDSFLPRKRRLFFSPLPAGEEDCVAAEGKPERGGGVGSALGSEAPRWHPRADGRRGEA